MVAQRLCNLNVVRKGYGWMSKTPLKSFLSPDFEKKMYMINLMVGFTTSIMPSLFFITPISYTQ